MAAKAKVKKRKPPRKKSAPRKIQRTRKATPLRKSSSTRKRISKKVPVQKPIGRVTHFYGEIKVAIVKFSKPIRKGTAARFKGATTDFAQKLNSMQYDHKPIASAPKGKLIGIKVKSRVRAGDLVYSG